MTLTGNSILVESSFDSPPDNPLLMLQEWLELADKVGVSEPRSMVLSTLDKFNRPSSRVVLLKECDATGVIFGTSQYSAKGRDLQSNPWAAGNLWWRETILQVNFQGQVTQLSEQQSDEMFRTRPREGQAVSAVSRQSAPLHNEIELRNNVQRLIDATEEIERPNGWFAYHLTLASVEFWQGGQGRLHKRLRYDLREGCWGYQRLQP